MQMRDFKLAIIGCGRWGINHVRTSHELFGESLVLVSDEREPALERANKICGHVRVTTDMDEIINNSDVNAVIVATPAETHYRIVRRLLEADKSVLVEKPITLDSSDARDLIELTEKRDLRLMVGHLLLYHPAIIRLKELLTSGKVGKLQYIYSNRLNFGTVRTEENILWSFAPHDISIIQYLTGTNPISVIANGASFLQTNIEDSTITSLTYPNNVHAHIFVSWLHPFKEHRLVVIGDRGMVAFEDNLLKEKLKFYPKCFKANNGTIEKLDGDFEVIPYDDKQPLAEEQHHFAECVVTGRRPLTDGNHALEVLEILEKAERSLKENAVRVEPREVLCK